jgi:uncharacterized short protein YbdD (DUF466 family)
MTQALVMRLSGIARVLRAVLGAPDYERYLDHVKAAHPECEPMSRNEFMRDRMNDRYSRPGTRCC